MTQLMTTAALLICLSASLAPGAQFALEQDAEGVSVRGIKA